MPARHESTSQFAKVNNPVAMLSFAMAQLDNERNAAVRAFVEKRIAERFKDSRSAYAKAAKLSPSVISELLNGGRGAGLRVVDRIASEAGVSPDVVTGRAPRDESPPRSSSDPFGTAWGAVRALARVHRHVPWWEIRARVALAEACAPW